MENQAQENLEIINRIKADLALGNISYEQAKLQAEPVIKRINDKARELAKKYNQRPRLVSFGAIFR